MEKKSCQDRPVALTTDGTAIDAGAPVYGARGRSNSTMFEPPRVHTRIK